MIYQKKTVYVHGQKCTLAVHKRPNDAAYRPALTYPVNTNSPVVTDRHITLATAWANYATAHPEFNPNGMEALPPLSVKPEVRTLQIRAHARRIALWEEIHQKLFELHTN
jgi:hypothetical protein